MTSTPSSLSPPPPRRARWIWWALVATGALSAFTLGSMPHPDDAAFSGAMDRAADPARAARSMADRRPPGAEALHPPVPTVVARLPASLTPHTFAPAGPDPFADQPAITAAGSGAAGASGAPGAQSSRRDTATSSAAPPHRPPPAADDRAEPPSPPHPTPPRWRFLGRLLDADGATWLYLADEAQPASLATAPTPVAVGSLWGSAGYRVEAISGQAVDLVDPASGTRFRLELPAWPEGPDTVVGARR